MYVIPIILLAVILIFMIILHFRKRRIIKKIRGMSFEERCSVLNDISRSFGYCYEPAQDIFSSNVDAWQRSFGFRHSYDAGAPYLGMVYDCQPVYFEYDGRTWLIELWKGQYGINTGCELGVYHTDTVIPADEYKSTVFAAASDDELLPLSVTLRKGGKNLGSLRKPHWWLTIFDMGVFSRPKRLSMEVAVTFPNCRMLNAFRSAVTAVMPDTPVSVRGHTVYFIYGSRSRYSLWMRIVRAWMLAWCCLLCSLFRFVTRPFRRSGDRILYMYYYLPSVFRKALRLRRMSKKS